MGHAHHRHLSLATVLFLLFDVIHCFSIDLEVTSGILSLSGRGRALC